jgi:ATP-dependent exoDNAse (exonuclease V) beta subunit
VRGATTRADLSADANVVQAAASVQGRIVDATQEEMSAAIATIGRVLEHPILRRAAASAGSGGLRRETPILLTRDDGSLVEGILALAFREDAPDFAGWTVVDFKTDREFEESSERYIAQVRVYSKAVGAATSSPARGVLLVV